jgi:hypothetical protein
VKKKLFPATMEPTSADLDAIGDVAEEGLGDFVLAIASQNDPTGVIFSIASPPTASANPPPWTITIPDQHFSINGIVGKLTQTTFVVAAGARDVAVFLSLARTVVTGVRNYLDLSGASPVIGTDTFDVETQWVADYIVVDPYTGPGDDPATPADGVGLPIKLALLTVTGSPAITIDPDPDGRLWIVPAGTPADHGSSHITDGGDPIPEATTLDAGLMSADDKAIVDAAITGISVAAGSEFLTATTSGTPDQTELAVVLDSNSLRKTTQDKLAVKFLSGGNAGVSETPARSDHKHAMSDSPVQVIERSIVVSAPAQLGTSIAVSIPQTIGSIVAVECFWVAPNITAPYYPLIEARWTTATIGGVSKKIGCKAQIRAVRDLRIQIGPDGLCELSTDDYTLAKSAAGGSQTWDAVGGSGGLIPMTGRVVVRILGARVGLSL